MESCRTRRPAGIAPETVCRLHAAFTAGLNTSEVNTRFATLMAEPAPTSPEAFARFINGERSQYECAVKISGATVDWPRTGKG